MAGDRPGAAPGHARRLEAIPRSVRSILHAAATKTSRSGRKSGRRTRRRRKRCAPAPSSWPSRASGSAPPRRSAGCRRTGRRSVRCAGASPRRCGSASAPHAISSSIATSGATRSSSKSRQADREALAVELEALLPAEGLPGNRPPICSSASARCARAGTSPRPAVKQGADPLSARFVAAIERLLSAYPDAFKGTELDVEASRQRMEKLCARVEGFVVRQRAGPVVVAGARRDAARGARLQHDRRPRRRRIQVARDGRRRASGAGVVGAAGAGAGRDAAGRWRTASTRRATGSSSSPGATCRRSSHRRVADGPSKQRARQLDLRGLRAGPRTRTVVSVQIGAHGLRPSSPSAYAAISVLGYSSVMQTHLHLGVATVDPRRRSFACTRTARTRGSWRSPPSAPRTWRSSTPAICGRRNSTAATSGG